MKRGRKPETRATKIARGTVREDRDGSKMQLIPPDALPQVPDWLTHEGQGVWYDNIGRVASIKTLSELDSDMFAQYCNLQGMNIVMWRQGQCPPVTALQEARRMAEMFGLAGHKSRIGIKDEQKTINPFTRNGAFSA